VEEKQCCHLVKGKQIIMIKMGASWNFMVSPKLALLFLSAFIQFLFNLTFLSLF